MNGEYYHCVAGSAGDCPTTCWEVDSYSSAMGGLFAPTKWTNGGVSVVRTVTPSVYQPGTPVHVNLTITPPPGTSAYAVEEQPPPGWVVSGVSDKGGYDPILGRVKWGVFLDGRRRKVCYDLTLLTEQSGCIGFDGVASYDGRGERISGDIQLCDSLSITGVASRRFHGSAGSFDVAMGWAGKSSGVECRTGGPCDVIVSFSREVSPDSGSASLGTMSNGPASNQKTIVLSDVTDASCVTIDLFDIVDLEGQPLAFGSPIALAILAGDVNGDGKVNVFDMLAVKEMMNQPVTADNCRRDVTADGKINVFDLMAVQRGLNKVISETCP